MFYYKIIILSIVIIGFLLITNVSYSFAQEPLGAPETFEEAQTIGEKVLTGLPKIFKGIWQEALAIWGKMADWFANLWYKWLQSIWQRIRSFLGKEVEERRPEIEEEFEKEKEEMREEIPKVSKSLWQRFKELIK